MKNNLTKDFLDILKEGKEEEDVKDVKEQISDTLSDSNYNSIQDEAKNVLLTLSNKSIGWGKLFSAVEEFRQDIRQRDKRSTTANDRQIGLASPLLVLFELILTTDLKIMPIDKDIIIKTMIDNFSSKEQVDELKKLVKIIDPSV